MNNTPLSQKHCVPCEGGTEPLTIEREDELLSAVPDWEILRVEPHQIVRELVFKNFREVLSFVHQVGGLAESEGHHPNLYLHDFKKLQNDNYSHFARELTPYILSAFRTTGRSERIETALNYFRNWNYILDKDDVPTTIFEVFFQHLINNTYRDEMGDELYNRYIFLANMPYRVTMSLLADTSTTWFDNTATPAIETRDDIIVKSVNDALDELSVLLGGEMKEWRWGRLHTLTLQHPFGEMEILKSIFNIGPTPVGGSGTSVNNGEYRMGKPYSMWLGPSMRHIVDFSNVNGSLSVIPSGQSGQPLHPHYSDQFPLWKNGEYHIMSLDVDEIATKSKNILYLTPSR